MNKWKLGQFILIITILLMTTSCSVFGPSKCCQTTTDRDITTNVQTRLAGDYGIRDQNVDVVTHERIVSLHGTVANSIQARKAICLALSVPCVRYVRSFIKIYRVPHYPEAITSFYD